MSKVINNVIDLTEVEMLLKRRAAINSIDVRDAVLVRNNKVVEVDKETREGWRFTGLNTIDFANAVSHGTHKSLVYWN